ncbi:MAG TPA: RecX family transcriptional regulator [Rectinemataceae bacterium]|nr:RecX family transcriptional regulator [Rectinemataceae bacterium]
MLLDKVESGASGLVKISAGETAIFVRLEFWVELGREWNRLFAGAELDEEEAVDLVVAAKATEAEARGASLLGRAEQPRFILRSKLIERGYPGSSVELALERLEREGFLSDRRYAEAWLRARIERAIRASRSSSPGSSRAEGPSSLLVSLRARSVGEADAKAALSAVLDAETRQGLLEAAIARLSTHKARPGAEDDGGERIGRARDGLVGDLRELGWKGEEIREALGV